MNEMNIHTIANLQRYVWSYGFPKLPILGFGKTGISTQETHAFHQWPQESEKCVFLKIWRDMGKEVKVVLLHVKIILYHWYDPVYDEGGVETY